MVWGMVWVASCIRWWLRLFDISIARMSCWISNEVAWFGLNNGPPVTFVTSSTNSWVSAEIILVDSHGLAEIILALLSGRNILSLSIHEEWTNHLIMIAVMWMPPVDYLGDGYGPKSSFTQESKTSTIMAEIKASFIFRQWNSILSPFVLFFCFFVFVFF